jgi:hypothetical protein
MKLWHIFAFKVPWIKLLSIFFSFQANLGHMDNRSDCIDLIVSNLALIQLQVSWLKGDAAALLFLQQNKANSGDRYCWSPSHHPVSNYF